jgi:hypothetical protein
VSQGVITTEHHIVARPESIVHHHCLLKKLRNCLFFGNPTDEFALSNIWLVTVPDSTARAHWSGTNSMSTNREIITFDSSYLLEGDVVVAGDVDVLVPLVPGLTGPRDGEDDPFLASVTELVVEDVQILQRGLEHLGVVRPHAEAVAVTEVLVGDPVMILLRNVVSSSSGSRGMCPGPCGESAGARETWDN